MYTPEALLDIHDRAQRSLKKLLDTCRVLSPEELSRELPGFGYKTVREQLEHIIGSGDYWMLVFEGEYKDDAKADAAAEGAADAEGASAQDGAEPAAAAAAEPQETASAPRYADIDALEAYRSEIDALSRDLIAAQSTEQLSTARDFYCWPGKWRSMVPARIVMRIATHVYHHQGQVLAMCRAMGHTFEEGFDFPLD